MRVEELLKREEGKDLEFKQDLSSSKNIVKTVIAFANTSGGTLLIGVEDKTKSVKGINDPHQEEERLSNILSSLISPKIIPNIEVVSWRDTYLLSVEIYPSNTRPHFLVKDGLEKGTYIRIGSSNRVADSSIISELQRLVLSKSFDEQPLIDLNSEAIDFRVASELYAEYKPLKKSDLETLKLVTKEQRKLVPTVAGILLFGKNRLNTFPDAWVQAGRFKGKTKTNIQDSQEINTNLPQLVEESINFVKKHSELAYEISEAKRKERWSVPLKAIREAVINAIVHCDYSQSGSPIRISIFDDRIEIENPGFIPFNLTLEDILSGVSKLRNPIIGRVFHDLKLIEKWGSGLSRIREACNEMGLAEPKFEEIGTHFRVTIFAVKIKPPTLDKIDMKILDALKDTDGMSTKNIAETIKLSVRATRTRLINLIERNLIVEISKSPQDPMKKYYLK